MVNIFFKFWRNFSVAVVSIVILFCYTSLPESIAIGHNQMGKPEKFIDKQTFFYWAAGVIFLFNFLMSMLDNQLQKINFKAIFPTSAWAQSSSLKVVLKGWLNAFLALVNTYLIFVLLGLSNINSNKGQVLDFNYNWLLVVGGVILMFLIFWVPLKLLFTQPKLHEDD
jgi:hypothetical protein